MKTDSGKTKKTTTGVKSTNEAEREDGNSAKTGLSEHATSMIDSVKGAFKNDTSVGDRMVAVVTVIDEGGESGVYGELHKMLFDNEGTQNDDNDMEIETNTSEIESRSNDNEKGDNDGQK